MLTLRQESLTAEACREILKELLEKGIFDEQGINRLKRRICKKYGLKKVPTNADLLSYASPQERDKLLRILRLKPVRTISGIAVVAVMAKPFPCPHGKCIYCPGGPNSVFGDVPQSYTGREPATMRALNNNFDPYLQVKSRIEQLMRIGHTVDKVELIIMGGTFPATPLEYQEHFVKRCLDAITGVDSRDLEEAKKFAEASKIRVTGITVETRPDYCKEKHIDEMLRMGVTRVEVGVQTIYDEIYQMIRRGHTVKDVIEATRQLKDSGLKVTYHLMPGLPGSDVDRDFEMFKEVFSNPDFKPDELKIYPTLVIRGTELYEMWREGKYSPLDEETLIDLLVRIKREVIPRYVRIKRIMRDIPANVISAGPKKGNLRELVLRRLLRMGLRCRCIRCREVGHVKAKFGLVPSWDNIRLITLEYEASEGTEVFISYEDVTKDILIGFLRLRIPSEHAHRPEIKGKRAALVRELHVYGPSVALHKEPSEDEWQHRGFGRNLLKEAERIALEEFDVKKILVTSGIGVREYYYTLGYKPDGPYVSKTLR
ncbi:MAG: tRNA uridine(34) 5-carboxymethylaminomethyl modification radical SAM/GNAT enzyme Elp3 [Candidatus Baldrarchaeia archaeon]